MKRACLFIVVAVLTSVGTGSVLPDGPPAGSSFSASALADNDMINAVTNLGPEEIIKAKGQEIVVPGYSVGRTYEAHAQYDKAEAEESEVVL